MKKLLTFLTVIILTSQTSLAQENKSEIKLSKTYSNNVFSLRYPADFLRVSGNRIAATYFSESKKINGLVLIKKAQDLTNGATISVEIEKVPAGKKCNVSLFGSVIEEEWEMPAKIVKDENVTYQITEVEDDEVSKHQNEKIFVIESDNPCIAVRYFYGSNAADNIDGMKDYDFAGLIKTFDAIRRSIVVK